MKTRLRLLALALAAGVAACAPQGAPDERTTETVEPRSEAQWKTLLSELRAFERELGFGAMPNFERFAPEKPGFPFCGTTSRTRLPYSYQDGAITWSEVADESACREAGAEADVLFTESEAVGERASPVTPSMLSAPMPRLVYLVIHEDCHDQFELPFGVEEPLCNLITFRAMRVLAARGGPVFGEHRAAIERYAADGEQRARETVGLYGTLVSLYDQHAKGKLSLEAVLAAREPVFREAEKRLEWPENTANNVWMANSMTYARHYAPVERMLETLGGDLPKLVEFFRRVDREKPQADAFARRRKLKDQEGAAFLEAYERAVLATADTLLNSGRGN